MTVPHNLKRNAYLDDLGTDWVAVADNGEIVGRADSEAAIRHAVPHASHFLNAAHLGDTSGLPIAAAALSATDLALEQVRAQSEAPKAVEPPAKPAAEQPVAHTARPPAPKRVEAHEPPAKTVKVPARKAASAKKRTKG